MVGGRAGQEFAQLPPVVVLMGLVGLAAVAVVAEEAGPQVVETLTLGPGAGQWETASPAEFGLDAKDLTRAAEEVARVAPVRYCTALAVGGKLVLEINHANTSATQCETAHQLLIGEYHRLAPTRSHHPIRSQCTVVKRDHHTTSFSLSLSCLCSLARSLAGPTSRQMNLIRSAKRPSQKLLVWPCTRD